MSKEDLMNIIGSQSHHTLYNTFLDNIKNRTIINIYMVDGELIKIGGDSDLNKNNIFKVTPDFITIKYDSHLTDYMFSAIKKIEYY